MQKISLSIQQSTLRSYWLLALGGVVFAGGTLRAPSFSAALMFAAVFLAVLVLEWCRARQGFTQVNIYVDSGEFAVVPDFDARYFLRSCTYPLPFVLSLEGVDHLGGRRRIDLWRDMLSASDWALLRRRLYQSNWTR